MKHFWATLIVSMTLSLCASTSYAAEGTETSDTATVYFIRERAEPTAWPLNILVDDKKVASVKNKSYVVVKIAPGSHLIALKWPPLAGQKNVKNTLSFEANSTIYYLVAADFSNIRILGGTWHSDRSMNVAEISKEEAEAIMAKFKR